MTKSATLNCSVCGAPMWGTKDSAAVGCCQPCRRRLTTEEKLKRGILRPRPVLRCERCGSDFTPKVRGRAAAKARFCSVVCANGGVPGGDRYKNQRKMSLRRARLRAALVEVVDPLTLFTRDGWRCHICGKRVRQDLPGNHPAGPTIDHLIPLSQGGDHSYANTALAHRRCNVAKGVRAVGDQLALVG